MFSYSGNPAASTLDAARFLVGDTDSSAPIMQDEEINYILDLHGATTNTSKYYLFLRAATLFARDIKKALGPQSEDPSGRVDFFKQQAAYYKTLSASSGISSPIHNHPAIFHIGMTSNPPWPAPPNGGSYV